ncbi:hypothetical protein N7444_003392 [Penicillium canescens]|nr:hypothetical protein N7444_003392 [Penicillium canescens]
MDTRPASEYAQPDQTSAAASAHYTPQPEVRPTYTPQPEVRPNISSSNTPQSDYGLNPPPTARSPAYHQDYLHRPPQSYAPNSQPGGAADPSPSGQQPHLSSSLLSLPASGARDGSVPGPPAASSPDHHGLPGPYASPATTVGSASPVAATAGPRPGQVYSFVPIPGAQQHKRPRRRYEEIERMYKCGWQGCEKAYGTLNHLNAHVTMQSHGAKRTPEEFKEIRKEWKARKKEEEAQRKAVEERERAAAQAAQANQVEAPNPSDPSHGQPPAYGSGVRPQLPPIGYQPADSQVPGQYGAPLVVAWSIRTDRWHTLQTTLTLPTRADRCTRNVSNVAITFRIDPLDPLTRSSSPDLVPSADLKPGYGFQRPHPSATRNNPPIIKYPSITLWTDGTALPLFCFAFCACVFSLSNHDIPYP